MDEIIVDTITYEDLSLIKDIIETTQIGIFEIEKLQNIHNLLHKINNIIDAVNSA